MKSILFLILFLPSLSFAGGAELSLVYSGLDGGVYVGGQKTPASFHELSLSYRGPGSIYGGVELTSLYNESATKVNNALFLLGKRFELPHDFSASLEMGLGFSLVEEKTSLQDVGGFGFGLGVQGRLSYRIHENWSVGTNLSWKHYTYCDSFWGKDIFQDLVIDQLGLGLFLTYHF